MWFKSCYIYNITSELPADFQVLQEMLAEKRLEACSASKAVSQGWVSPFGRGNDILVHGCGPFWLICLGVDQKLLPASIVREEVQARILEIEQNQQRKVYGKEKAALRDDIEFEFLSKAFVKKSQIAAFIDTDKKRLVVDVSSDSKADEFISNLLEAMDLKLELLQPELSLNQQMTKWLLAGEGPEYFTLAKDCVMEDLEQANSRVRFAQQDLTASEVLNIAKNHRRVSEISLIWQDRIQFNLKSNLALTRIKFFDVVKEQLAEDEGDLTQVARLDRDFALMSLELTGVISALLDEVL